MKYVRNKDLVASMGPWLCSHGNRDAKALEVVCDERLQWGRGCVATEIYRVRRAADDGRGFNGAVAV